MRTLVIAGSLALLVAGCASLRGPVVESGPTLTIHNERFVALDLVYRCTENGPAVPLGIVRPGTAETFVLKPAFCSTVYLISRPAGVQPLGLDHKGEPAFATIQLLSEGATEVVFAAAGFIVRKDSANVARSGSEL